MELWQMDIVGGVFLESGTELKVVTYVDDHSRFCVAVGIVERATAPAVCRVFVEALRRHGVPEEILTDNGKVFTNRHGKFPMLESAFDRICRENGIVHRLTGVRTPTTTRGTGADTPGSPPDAPGLSDSSTQFVGEIDRPPVYSSLLLSG